MRTPPHCYILFGPTASGKSALAERVAEKAPARIINCDSKQVYRELPVLTAQPDAATRARLPHALYGHISVTERYTAREWLEDAAHAARECAANGDIPFFTGGTGMFVKALQEGISAMPALPEEAERRTRARIAEEGCEAAHLRLREIDPDSAARLAPGDGARIAKALCAYEETGVPLSEWHKRGNIRLLPEDTRFTLMTLERDRELLYARCEARFDAMLESGALEEARYYLKLEESGAAPAAKAHGLPELTAYLRGDMPLEEAKRLAKRNTRRYIKRQFTWMRHQMPGRIVLEGEDDGALADYIIGQHCG